MAEIISSQKYEPSTINTAPFSVAVRALAEAIHRQGGLGGPIYDSVSGVEGTRLHQKLTARFQKQFGVSSVLSELSFKKTVESTSIRFVLAGRCDLIILTPQQTTLFEIKSYSGTGDKLPPDGEASHWAQALLYAFLYAEQNKLQQITVGLIYVSSDHDELKELKKSYSYNDLEDFFNDTVTRFTKMAQFAPESNRLRDSSARICQFPFSQLRPGQKRLMNEVIGTARQKSVLFAQAPTGTGKTLSVLFPAIRLLAHHHIDKVFYLTAMTSTRHVAELALEDLRQNGLVLRSITLQAKEKSCLVPELYCKTKHCPYALNYYRNLPAALEELFLFAGHCFPADIAGVAKKHQVCPFELSLDYSLYCDVIIGDYNYAFDPRIQLARFFALPDQHHLLLVDEAHNLVDRSREMYSADFDFSKIDVALDVIKENLPAIQTQLFAIQSYGRKLADELKPAAKSEAADFRVEKGFAVVEQSGNNRQMLGDHFAAQISKPEQLLRMLGRLNFLLRQFLDDQPEFPEHQKILDLFLMSHFFCKIADLFYGPAYITTAALREPILSIKLMCLDAGSFLTDIYLNRHPAIFFSATLAPIQYYTGLLLANNCDQKPEILTLPSPFPGEHLKLLVETRYSTRYQERTATIQPIIEQILIAASSKIGNYLVFLPSYGYLKQVRQILKVHPRRAEFDFVVQIPSMDDAQKQQFLRKFDHYGQTTLIGLAVIGSLFNEGIDLTGERLSGVMIVGVGLPQISPEREIMSQYFAGKLGRGFEFAYQYPGFNKVLQAAGRVIRSETDIGFVLLFDDRYQNPDYQMLFPQDWQPVYLNEQKSLPDELSEFWSFYKSDNIFNR